MNIRPLEAPLTAEQRLEALKIAHETKDPEIRRAALMLLSPIWMAVADDLPPGAPEGEFWRQRYEKHYAEAMRLVNMTTTPPNA